MIEFKNTDWIKAKEYNRLKKTMEMTTEIGYYYMAS